VVFLLYYPTFLFIIKLRKALQALRGVIHMTDTLRFMGVNKDTTTAGPGKRLEFFTKGCIRGVVSPCEGCFNELTWTFEGKFRPLTVDEVFEICDRDAWNRQVTFCGGEPILQARAIIKVAKRLKEKDPTFHFVMYTAYLLDALMKHGLRFTWQPKHGEGMLNALKEYSHSYVEQEEGRIRFTILTPEDVLELMIVIDLIVDGDYQHDKRLTTEKYMHEGWFIGSANQRVIDGPRSFNEGELHFMYADEYNEHRQKWKQCKCCGHDLQTLYGAPFCDMTCGTRYQRRVKQMALLGGV
jgi:organic radical activating enzyme